MDEDKRLVQTSYRRDWLWGTQGLVLVGMLSKSLVQFPAYGWGCVLSL